MGRGPEGPEHKAASRLSALGPVPSCEVEVGTPIHAHFWTMLKATLQGYTGLQLFPRPQAPERGACPGPRGPPPTMLPTHGFWCS